MAYILIVFGIESTAQSQNTMNDSLVIWDDLKQLKFEDFRGIQDTSFLVYGSPANGAAVTKIQIDFSFDPDGAPCVKVTNQFIKEKSWIKIKALNVLSHEQGHFDISEIFARKIRKSADSLKECHIIDLSIYQNEFNKILNQKRKYQKLYDDKTKHGYSSSIQKQFEDVIKRKLNEYKNYSD